MAATIIEIDRDGEGETEYSQNHEAWPFSSGHAGWLLQGNGRGLEGLVVQMEWKAEISHHMVNMRPGHSAVTPSTLARDDAARAPSTSPLHHRGKFSARHRTREGESRKKPSAATAHPTIRVGRRELGRRWFLELGWAMNPPGALGMWGDRPVHCRPLMPREHPLHRWDSPTLRIAIPWDGAEFRCSSPGGVESNPEGDETTPLEPAMLTASEAPPPHPIPEEHHVEHHQALQDHCRAVLVGAVESRCSSSARELHPQRRSNFGNDNSGGNGGGNGGLNLGLQNNQQGGKGGGNVAPGPGGIRRPDRSTSATTTAAATAAATADSTSGCRTTQQGGAGGGNVG